MKFSGKLSKPKLLAGIRMMMMMVQLSVNGILRSSIGNFEDDFVVDQRAEDLFSGRWQQF